MAASFPVPPPLHWRVSGASGGNVGYYECIITNTVSTNISFPAPLSLLVSTATNISLADDPIVGFGDSVTPPVGQDVTKTIDGTLAKYLNNGANGIVAPFTGPVGYVTSPNAGNTLVTAMRFFAASDIPGRDPADYLLEGSNDGINFTAISSGALALSDVRNENLTDPIDVTDQVLQEVDFPNSTGYFTYRVTFNNVKDERFRHQCAIQRSAIARLRGEHRPGIERATLGTQTFYADAGQNFAGASVSAYGVSPFSYQWYQGANPLAGQTTATLSAITNVQVANAGSYYCVVSNLYGGTNSTAVTLNVIAAPPIILTQPSGNKTMYVGGTLTASVTVTGTPPTLYQWYVGATALPGQTTANLKYKTTSLADAGAYSCVISNEFGATNTTSLNLTLIPLPAGSYVASVAASAPIAWWRLDETDNGSGNTGTIATTISAVMMASTPTSRWASPVTALSTRTPPPDLPSPAPTSASLAASAGLISPTLRLRIPGCSRWKLGRIRL